MSKDISFGTDFQTGIILPEYFLSGKPRYHCARSDTIAALDSILLGNSEKHTGDYQILAAILRK